MVKQLIYSAPNLIYLCVDHGGDEDLSGRIYHYYAEQPILFYGATDMLLKMEQFYDWLGIPQAERKTRRFDRKEDQGGGRRMNKVKNSDELAAHKGDLATFVVHVQYRQNATWQGKVIWTDEKQESSFRSALELIKLMDTAIESTAEDTGPTKRKANS